MKFSLDHLATRLKKPALILMVLFYVFTGVTHLLHPEVFERIVPPPLPPYLIAILSGLAELGLALLLIPLKTRKWAAWGIIALLIAVFPANIYMYVIRDQFPEIPAWALLVRLPMQIILIAWAYWFARAPRLH